MEIENGNLCFQLNLENKTATVINSPKAAGSVVIPHYVEHDGIKYKVISIGEDAFEMNKSKVYISFPDDTEIESFERYSFKSSKVKQIQIPASLKKISHCFLFCHNKPINFDVSPKNKYFSYYDNNFLVEKSNENNTKFDVLIFARIDIENALIPPEIKVLSNNSFTNCKKLKSIIFPENSELECIEDDAIRQSGVQKLVLPSSIKKSINFLYTSQLTHIEVSPKNDMFHSIDNKILLMKSKPKNQVFDLFVFCARDVENITIPSFIKTICGCAFYECSRLKSVRFESKSSLKKIENSAFGHLNEIKCLEFPPSLKKVERSAFFYMDNITTIKFLSKNIILNDLASLCHNITLVSLPNAKKVEFHGFLSSCNIENIKFEIRKDAEITTSPWKKDIKLFQGKFIYLESDPTPISSDDDGGDDSEISSNEEETEIDPELKALLNEINDYIIYENNEINQEDKINHDEEANQEEQNNQCEEDNQENEINQCEEDNQEEQNNQCEEDNQENEINQCEEDNQEDKINQDEGTNQYEERDFQHLKNENDILLKRVRFLEDQLSQYQKVIPFSEDTVQDCELVDYEVDNATENESKNNKENIIFFDDDDEKHQHIICRIGEGASSITYKVIDDRNSKVMCKKVLKINNNGNSFNDVKNIIKEFEVLAKIDHPSICKAIAINTQAKNSFEKSQVEEEGVYFDVEQKQSELATTTTVAIYLEYLPFSLKSYLGSNFLSNTMKVKIVVEIAFGMLHIHEIGMIHRDLKIENIMLNYIMEAKIIDFGLVRVNDPENATSLTRGIGTLAYMSPEMQNEEEYDSKTDVYSFGVVLFAMFTGKLPKQSMKDKLTNKPLTFPSASPLISDYCIELIKRCMNFNPQQRPSFDEILNDMKNNDFKLANEVDSEIILRRYRALNRLKSQQENLRHEKH